MLLMQISWKMLETIMRSDKIDKICLKVMSQNLKNETNPGMRLDKFLTHRFLGPVMALVIFYLIFQSHLSLKKERRFYILVYVY